MQVLKAYKWVPFICAEENFSFPPLPPSRVTKLKKKILRDVWWLQSYPQVAWLTHFKSVSQTRNILASRAFHLSNVFILSPLFFKFYIMFGSSLVPQDQYRNFPLVTDSKKDKRATRINESWNLRWWKRDEKFQLSHSFIVTLTIYFF